MCATGSLTGQRPSSYPRPLRGGRTQRSCRGELYRELWLQEKTQTNTCPHRTVFHVGKRCVSAPRKYRHVRGEAVTLPIHSTPAARVRWTWAGLSRSAESGWDPLDCSPPGSCPWDGIFQARTLEWVAMPPSRVSSWSRARTWASCIAVGFFTTDPPEVPQLGLTFHLRTPTPQLLPFLQLAYGDCSISRLRTPE